MKKPFQVFSFSIVNQDNGKAEVHIDGDIVDASTQKVLENWFGDDTSTSYKSFRNEINKLSFNELDVIINSSGGHVGDAMAIHDYLVDLQTKQGKTVNTIGRGIVASSATLVLLAGEKPTMSENSMFLMHEVSSGIYGTVSQVENYAKAMRKFNNQIRDLYVKKSGLAQDKIDNMMKEETWLNAEEVESMGFVATTPSVAFENKIDREKWPFQNTVILNQYNSSVKTNHSNSNFSDFMKSFNDTMKDLKETIVNIVKGDKKADKETVDKVENALKPLEELDIDKQIKDAVTKAVKPLKNQIEKLQKEEPEEEEEENLEEEVDENDLEEEMDDDNDKEEVENKGKGKDKKEQKNKKPVTVEARLAAIEKENKDLKMQMKQKLGNKTGAGNEGQGDSKKKNSLDIPANIGTFYTA